MIEGAIMNPRRTARIVGALFIVATAASMIGSLVFTKPILDDPNYLVKLSESHNRVLTGSLLSIIAAFASAGIAIGLYPVLRKHGEGLALGSVVFRAIESISYSAGAVINLSLLSLSQEFVKANDAPYFQAMGSSLLSAHDWIANVLGVSAFSVGGFLYYIVFYKSRLIPRWLSLWGIIGIVSVFSSALLVMFSVIPALGAVQGIMAAPIGLQEMVLAIWLIVRGFNQSVDPEPVNVQTASG
jgi:hypothetical protein